MTTTASVLTVKGGITAPLAFQSAALHCGIKESELDLVLLTADLPIPAAGLFTTNLVRAAPVTLSQQHLKQSGGYARGIVVNSGCANACTGDKGWENAEQMAITAARALGCQSHEILLASTGVIGVDLPIELTTAGIQTAATVLTRDESEAASRAIMTTDPFPKEHAVTIQTKTGTFTVGGMAKGSGMIEPMMATMLGFLTTDAQVPPTLLQQALNEVADETFNAITVDGDCSTNDSLFALASGASDVVINDSNYQAFLQGLQIVSKHLAMEIVRGGEGATKLVAITVSDAKSKDEARRVARTVANSLLVKTAIHGADPNWGRILAAAGRSGVMFNPSLATVSVGGVLLFEHGTPHDEASPKAGLHLQSDTVEIEVGLGLQSGFSATVWTCDLSAEYVRINGEYRT
jgi:glutamate N-acetyltransferase/amino-acid N-acetyltransferase